MLEYPYAWYSTEAADQKFFLDQVSHPQKPLLLDWNPQSNTKLKPRVGTVSHHLLASWYIDRWFFELAQRGNYQKIYILSPRHYQQGSQKISLSPLDWNSGFGLVKVAPEVKALKMALNLPWDPWAFHGEHGIGTLIPFIKKYFSNAQVIPIVLEIEERNMPQLRILAAELSQLLKADPLSFLIISTDFSHHADLGITQARDNRTKIALQNLNSDTYLNTYSDNVSGFTVVGWVLESLNRTRGNILAHTNSWRISGLDDDITSYFFTFY